MAVLQGSEYRQQILAGIDILADAVAATLGPKGRNVVMPQKRNIRGAEYTDTAAADAPILTTNDGVTIARAIELSDAVQNMGVELCREAAIKAEEEAGDGTTTAVILVRSLLRDAFANIEAGADPVVLHRGIVRAAEVVRTALAEAAVPIDTEDDLARVATISCGDEKLGALIAHALYSVGLEGVVEVEDLQRMETTLDLKMGIVFDRGFLSPHMTTDQHHSEAVLDDPYILLTDMEFNDPQDLIPALICAAEDGRDCLVICGAVGDEVRGLIAENKRHGDLNIVCVDCPAYGEGRLWRMDDLAVQLGGFFIRKDGGLNIREVTKDMLGSAKHVRVTSKRTTITGAGGDPVAVKERERYLRQLAETTEYEFNRKRHQERLAAFVSGVATISVGGITEAEIWERKMRIEDAVNAAGAAWREGVVAGGGAALIRIAPRLEALANTLAGDERTGVLLVRRALDAPAKHIAENAGKVGSVVLEHVRGLPDAMGYDARRDSFVDMFEAGIIDPVRVTRSALDAGFSVASTALLTEAGITNPERLARERRMEREDQGLG